MNPSPGRAGPLGPPRATNTHAKPSPIRTALPWSLLTLSLAAHLWLWLHPPQPIIETPPPAPPLQTVRYIDRVTPAPNVPRGASAKAHTQPVPTPAPAQPTHNDAPTLSAYAELLTRTLETGEQQADLARLLSRWVAVDPVGAATWIATQPDDPRYDPALYQLTVHLTAQGDYELAEQWADNILTPSVRTDAMEQILTEQYRNQRISALQLTTAAAKAGVPPIRVQGILDYSLLD